MTTSRWPFAVAALASVTLLTAIPYVITTMGASSICLREGGISTERDKIRAALAFVRINPPEYRRTPYTFDASQSCCEVDKGQGDDPVLGISRFYLSAKSHYVHVPLISRDSGFSLTSQHRIKGLVTVDGCGTALNEGVDL